MPDPLVAVDTADFIISVFTSRAKSNSLKGELDSSLAAKQYPKAIRCASELLTVARDLQSKASRIDVARCPPHMREKVMEETQSACHELASILNLNGVVRANSEDPVGARPFFAEALECVESSIHGRNHPDILTFLANLAGIETRLKNFEQSIRLIERRIALIEKQFSPEHVQLVGPLIELAVCMWNNRTRSTARRVLARALCIGHIHLAPTDALWTRARKIAADMNVDVPSRNSDASSAAASAPASATAVPVKPRRRNIASDSTTAAPVPAAEQPAFHSTAAAASSNEVPSAMTATALSAMSAAPPDAAACAPFPEVCAACGRGGATATCLCLQVYYCNKDCSTRDWKQHKKTCPMAKKAPVVASKWWSMNSVKPLKFVYIVGGCFCKRSKRFSWNLSRSFNLERGLYFSLLFFSLHPYRIVMRHGLGTHRKTRKKWMPWHQNKKWAFIINSMHFSIQAKRSAAISGSTWPVLPSADPAMLAVLGRNQNHDACVHWVQAITWQTQAAQWYVRHTRIQRCWHLLLKKWPTRDDWQDLVWGEGSMPFSCPLQCHQQSRHEDLRDRSSWPNHKRHNHKRMDEAE
jgi:hypothetical protein